MDTQFHVIRTFSHLRHYHAQKGLLGKQCFSFISFIPLFLLFQLTHTFTHFKNTNSHQY